MWYACLHTFTDDITPVIFIIAIEIAKKTVTTFPPFHACPVCSLCTCLLTSVDPYHNTSPLQENKKNPNMPDPVDVIRLRRASMSWIVVNFPWYDLSCSPSADNDATVRALDKVSSTKPLHDARALLRCSMYACMRSSQSDSISRLWSISIYTYIHIYMCVCV
jgi:hypothetical protein